MSEFSRDDQSLRLLSESELRRRWRGFRRDVRRVNASPLARLVGPLLGDDTWRRRYAEKLRPTHQPTYADPAVNVAFPPRVRLTELNTVSDTPPDVAVVATSGPVPPIEAITTALATAAQWLYLADHHIPMSEHNATMQLLLAQAHDADVIFGDEATSSPPYYFWKPTRVSRHTLWSYNVIGRPALLRTSAIREVGGFDPSVGAAMEHDLYLRLYDEGAQFRHVPIVVSSGSYRARVNDDTLRVVATSIERQDASGDVSASSHPDVIDWQIHPSELARVDIIIPTRDRVDLLRQCIARIESLTTYRNFGIIILDNDSVESSTLEYLDNTSHQVIPCPGPFNYAAIINRGVAHSRADYVVTLNNDTIVQTPDWLERLLGVASLPDVVLVGATMVDDNGHHEHDGIAIAPYPQHLQLGRNYLTRDAFISARRDVSAVTGALQMIARADYLALGGMDESLRVVMNDVDLCLRAQADGRHVVILPDVVVTHFASATRGRLDPLADRNIFVRRWDVFGQFRDPYFPAALQLLGNYIVQQDS